MSADVQSQQALKQREFLSLLPVTLAIAGLPHSEHGKYYNEGQMEARMTTLKMAYRFARTLVVDASK